MSTSPHARRWRASFPLAPLSPDFGRLWWASAITNLGDGALLAAGPLLIASVSTDPAAVAGGVLAQQLPWLLFALTSGALVDRLPRRLLAVAVNAARAGTLALLSAAVWFDAAQLWVIYAALFLLGTGETLADIAYTTLVATVVPQPLLGRANARLALASSLNNQLLGPPLGALMFATSIALPFGTAAATVRQQVTPSHLLGRVTSAYRLADLGGAALGALLGGLLARTFGLLAPFWVACAAVGLLSMLVWEGLGRAAPCPT